MTVTETVEKQQRFFCESCKREVFLSAKYCDHCGGEIEWPEKVEKILVSWKKAEKKR
jgi:predicted amidophosphoribosyltransferase